MSSTPLGRRLDLVHRLGAAALGTGLCVFGALGVADRLEFLAVHGKVILGLSSNGLLSAISLVVGGILIGAALRGGRSASTVTVVIGLLFLLSGLVNLAVLDTPYNLLAFRLPNVFFSFVVGMLLLFLGAYGRFSGGLTADNPYYQLRHREGTIPGYVSSASSADDELAAAELAVAEGHATPEQERLVREDIQRRAYEAYVHAWQAAQSRTEPAEPPPYWRGASYLPWSIPWSQLWPWRAGPAKRNSRHSGQIDPTGTPNP